MPHYSFSLDGRFFRTKKAAQDAARAVLNSNPLFRVFTSALLSDLVGGYHYYCSKHGLRPVRFRKMPREKGGYELQGWFDELNDWHGVSYLKCINPPDFEDFINKALRDAIFPLMRALEKPACEKCGSRYRLEVDHVRPKFKEMFLIALQHLDDKDRAAWASYNWVTHASLILPRDGGAVKKIFELHQTATIQTLCAPCHRNVKRPSGRSTSSLAGTDHFTRESPLTSQGGSVSTTMAEPASTRGLEDP
jgi:hypothetical protein